MPRSVFGPKGWPSAATERDVGFIRIHDNFAIARLSCSPTFSSFAAIERFVDSIAVRDLSANAGLARAHINSVVIGTRDRQAADISTAFLSNTGDRSSLRQSTSHTPPPVRAEIISRGIARNPAAVRERPPRNGPIMRYFMPLKSLVFRLTGNFCRQVCGLVRRIRS